MLLKDYVEQNKIDVKMMAKELMISDQYLNRLINGWDAPSKRLAYHVQNYTKGHVTIAEMEDVMNKLPRCPHCNQYMRKPK